MGNRETALALAANGAFVFPCQGGAGPTGKQPVPGMFWRSSATTDADEINRWWNRWPRAAPAIDQGRSGFFVIDCDVTKDHGEVDGLPWFTALAESHDYDISDVPGALTPSGGRHLYFRQPDSESFGNSRGGLPPKKECGVDVRGKGGYCIAPGAVMGEDRTYQPLGDLSEAPPMPDWLIALMRAPIPEPPPVVAIAPAIKAAPSPASPARLASYAQAAIDAEAATLRGAVTGERNNTLNTVAFKFGQMVGAGWLSEADAQSILEAGAADIGLVKDDGIRSVRATIRSGLRSGIKEPRKEPADRPGDGNDYGLSAWIERDGELFNPDTGESLSAGDMVPADGGDYAMPAHLMAPPGLVGDVAAWITATARRPNVVLNLGAALTVVGTAIGRLVAGPTLSGTHLYVIGLAATGTGKDHPLHCIGRLLSASGMKSHIGPSEFISMPAVINFLVRSPLSLCAQDEWGAFLKRINNRRASGFEASISKILRTAWGASWQAMMTPEWAGRPAACIHAPALSIYGISTEDEFWSALEGGDQNNGFLNRFLILPGSKRAAERDPLLPPLEVPQSIVDRLTHLYSGHGAFANANRNQSDMEPIDRVKLEWGDGAREIYRTFGAEIEARVDTTPGEQAFFARTVEMGLRIATIIAAGRGSMTVDVADMEYGRDLALWSGEALMRGAQERIADTEMQAEANRIRRIVREAGGKIGHSALLRAMKQRMRARELSDLIKGMIEAESLLVVKGEAKGGRPPIFYRLPTGV